MKCNPVTVEVEVPLAFITRFMNTYEKAHGVTLTTKELDAKLKEYIVTSFEFTVTRWAMQHDTI